ncbi:hypothetical protein [Arcticibacter sp. MXS-1]|uniref:hypothetical protein n=1 Tax=Arcticibacter sp. MXS-1 TaxID=3341726 RepID=UPI0035A93523
MKRRTLYSQLQLSDLAVIRKVLSKGRPVLLASLVTLVAMISQSSAQTTPTTKVGVTPFEGIIVAGYVDKGAYVNFTGPAVKFTRKPVSVSLGMMPSLRIKEDKVSEGAPKNSVITPSLGFGFTFSVRHLALQVPFYYNSKTAAKDGKWNPGIGIGYKF